MQCQFMTVNGYGKYDTDSWSIEVQSEKTALNEAKAFIKSRLSQEPLGMFMTSIFIPPKVKGGKVEIVKSLSFKEIDKSVKDIQDKAKGKNR